MSKVRKKSIKKHLEVGCLIAWETKEFFKVVSLDKNSFRARCIETGLSFNFYYNVDMIIYKEIAKNYKPSW